MAYVDVVRSSSVVGLGVLDGSGGLLLCDGYFF